MTSPAPESTPVTTALDRLGIPYIFFRHPGPVHSLEQAAIERNQRPEQVIRSILFRITDRNYVMVLVGGPKLISWPKLRSYLGVSRISMASPEEVQALTGYPIGAVSPFGIQHPIRILVDEGILQEGEISIGSGLRNTTIIMKQVDLMQALGEVEIGTFG